MTKKSLRNKDKQSVTTTRASVTFPPDIYQSLEALARQKKVSVAWVVREAAEKYLAEQWPLLEKAQ
jgi:predicted DNA-binding protein